MLEDGKESSDGTELGFIGGKPAISRAQAKGALFFSKYHLFLFY
jgi:hypothetical protein